MSDNKDIRGPHDASKINVHEDYELQYWTNKLGVTAEELKRAVQQVGVNAELVSVYLLKKK